MLTPAFSTSGSTRVAHRSHVPVDGSATCLTLAPLTYTLSDLVPGAGSGPLE